MNDSPTFCIQVSTQATLACAQRVCMRTIGHNRRDHKGKSTRMSNTMKGKHAPDQPHLHKAQLGIVLHVVDGLEQEVHGRGKVWGRGVGKSRWCKDFHGVG